LCRDILLLWKNVFGDIIAIYDSSHTLVGKYSYDAYGKCTVMLNTNSIATTNPFRYRGYYYDKETELYYCNYR